jgi:hypothetical protein
MLQIKFCAGRFAFAQTKLLLLKTVNGKRKKTNTIEMKDKN